MVERLPDLSRTLAALKAHDERLPLLMKAMDAARTDADLRKVLADIEQLEEAVGSAFGLDTSDRNNPEDCRKLCRPGPAVPPPGQELSFVRRMVAEWQGEKVDPRDLKPASDYFQKLDTRKWGLKG